MVEDLLKLALEHPGEEPSGQNLSHVIIKTFIEPHINRFSVINYTCNNPDASSCAHVNLMGYA